jgi:uncharacterized protein (DUF2062 family)
LFNADHSDHLKSISVGFGIFMGIVPIWGFQLMVAIFLAILFRLNKALVIIAANISIPPLIPFIIFLSYKLGGYWVGDNAMNLQYNKSISLSYIRENLQQYLYGSISLAIIAGIFFGLITFLFLKLIRKKSILAG